MVERFNRTLAAMLSAFVDENHRNWDEQLPYVMMAYRACDHETTGLSPNILMLGRETTTPLDILYQMPPPIAQIPVNQWVWELRENLESAHNLVRQSTGESMKRQKRYRDRKLSYETFGPGDNVYVFFPVKKVGCSSKLTSYWKGPFQVSEKLSDVLYKVNCGRSGSSAVIHCDRMKRARKQVLTGEEEHIRDDQIRDDNGISSEDEGMVPEYQTDDASRHRDKKAGINTRKWQA